MISNVAIISVAEVNPAIAGLSEHADGDRQFVQDSDSLSILESGAAMARVMRVKASRESVKWAGDSRRWHWAHNESEKQRFCID